MSKFTNKVVMPVVRKVVPNLIANQLVSVQPLSGATGHIFPTRFSFNDFDFIYPDLSRKGNLDYSNKKARNGNPHWRATTILVGDPKYKQLFKNMIGDSDKTFTKPCQWLVDAVLEFNGRVNLNDCQFDTICLIFSNPEDHLAFILKWG